MGRMIDGEWYTDAEQLDRSDDGEFRRAETSFRDRITADGAYPAEPGRYHLYISRACPWAHRTTIARTLLGLQHAISVDVVAPVREDRGWEFDPAVDGCTPDTVNGTEYLHEVYAMADPEYTGRVTVPVLWDRETDTIVNNESAEIVRMFDDAFDDHARNDVSLVPETDREAVDRTIDELYEPINNGVYRAGFAGSQRAYERAVERLFVALERWEGVLEDQRYLCGDRFTAADVFLFTTLYRFDEVYHTHFACNVAPLVSYPNLWNFTREVFQLPGVEQTCNMAHVKEHYYRSHTELNPRRLVPVGPDPEFGAAHDRDRLPGTPPTAGRGP